LKVASNAKVSLQDAFPTIKIPQKNRSPFFIDGVKKILITVAFFKLKNNIHVDEANSFPRRSPADEKIAVYTHSNPGVRWLAEKMQIARR
jgi:hypothetical protein